MLVKVKLSDWSFRVPASLLTIFSLFFMFLAIFSFAQVSFTAESPTNATIYNATIIDYDNSTGIWFNITTNVSLMGTCIFDIGLTNGTFSANQTMTNDTTTHFYNNTIITLIPSGYGQWHNTTFYCNESGAYNASDTLLFKIDTYNPGVDYLWNFTRTNSTADEWINITFNFTDRNPDTCGIYAYEEDGTRTWITGVRTPDAETANCTVRLFGENLTKASTDYISGDLIIEHFGNDTVDRNVYSATNESALITKLIASKWNLVTFSDLNSTGTVTDNVTVDSIANSIPGVTYIAVFDNRPGWKNYTTYGISTPTVNNDTTVHVGQAMYVYMSSEAFYIRKNYLSDGTVKDTYSNISLHTEGWNMAGLFKDKTMNETLYLCSYPQAGDCGDSDYLNVTYISWYNASESAYVTCQRGFYNCTGIGGGADTRVETITIPKAYAIWLNVANNITLNMTGY